MVDILEHMPHEANAASMTEDVHGDDRVAIRDKAYNLCKEYLEGRWETVPKRDFEFSVLSGGLTNKLYICRLPQCAEESDSNCPTAVVMRIYGVIIQDFAAQIQESVIFSILSERKIGPRLFAVFPGGRLEEYLECRTLITKDLEDPYLSQCIARRVANYHMMTMPVNKGPTTVMEKLQLYYENLHNIHFNEDEKHSLLMQLLQFDIGCEIQYLKKLINDIDAPVVFCHNDLQEGNLMQDCSSNEAENPIQLIDFEYSCYNYRGFDIGNHFCEWMFDYSATEWPKFIYKPENYPSRKQQENFVNAYLQEALKLSKVSGVKWNTDAIIEEANRFALLSHLFWSLWSVMQAKVSDIGFGYMEYALVRMDAYHNLKNQQIK